jgi:L-malate glycosyltransferase
MKKKTKILFIIRQLIIGGAESQLYELARRLDKGKYNVIVCSLSEGGYYHEKLQNEGIEVRVIKKKWRYDILPLFRILALIIKIKPKIVHCVMWTANMWGGLAALFAGSPKIILSTRSIGIWKKRIHYISGPFIFNRADLILANSKEVRNYMVKNEGIREDLIEIVYNGLDTAKYEDVRNGVDRANNIEKMGIPKDAFVIGCVANLSIQKDHKTLLAAAKRTLELHKNIYFLLVGDGVLRNMLENEARMIGIEDRIIFAGQRKDINKMLACMDIFVLTSIREGLSNALLEAMASGLPAIVTRIGGNIETIEDGRSGFLFDVGDDKKLAELINILYEKNDLRKQMGEFNKNRVRNIFNMDAHIKRMDEIYKKVLVGTAKI